MENIKGGNKRKHVHDLHSEAPTPRHNTHTCIDKKTILKTPIVARAHDRAYEQREITGDFEIITFNGRMRSSITWSVVVRWCGAARHDMSAGRIERMKRERTEREFEPFAIDSVLSV